MYAIHACYYLVKPESFYLQKKWSEDPQSSHELPATERWHDDLGLDLGGTEARGRVRGSGLGASWDKHFLESKKDALLSAKISKMMALELDRRGVGQILPPSPHDTEILRGSTEATPSQAVQRSCTASVKGCTEKQPSPVDDITISVGSNPSLE